MTITFDTMKTDVPSILTYLDTNVFVDSTINMMPDEYIKNAVSERLCQVVLMNEGLVKLNEDKQALSRAMLRSSLDEKDINFILGASLKISQVKVNIGTAPAPAVAKAKKGTKAKGAVKKSSKKKIVDTKKDEVSPDNANDMIKAKMENMCSIDTLIGIIKDNLGTSRIVPTSSQHAVMEAMLLNQQNNTTVAPINDMLYIERPLELNLDFIDLARIDNSQIFDFFSGLMENDSNSSLGLLLPIEAFVDSVKTFLTTDLEAVCQTAVAFAKNSAKNSISFTAEADPFKSLFDTL